MASTGDPNAIEPIANYLLESAQDVLRGENTVLSSEENLCTIAGFLLNLNADMYHIADSLLALSENFDISVQLRLMDALMLTKSSEVIGTCHRFISLYIQGYEGRQSYPCLYRITRVVNFLAEIGSKESVPNILRLLTEIKEGFIAWPCVSAIVDLLGDDAIPPLIQIYDISKGDGFFVICRCVIQAIGRIGSRRGYECVAGLICSDDWDGSQYHPNPIPYINKAEFLPVLVKELHKSFYIDRLISLYCEELFLTVFQGGEICPLPDRRLHTALPVS